MKRKLFIMCTLVLGAASSSFAQTDVNLNLTHTFGTNPFSYGTTYILNGTAISFSRVQYYLSGFELTHDGGQTTSLPDAYVLGSGNISNYTLGQANVTTVEGLNFDLGVDYTRNHMGTSNWPAQHPLASQSPTMDWSWPDGYFFFAITGMVDNTGDGTPNASFELHGIGDVLLTNVTSFSGLNASGATIELDFYVNVADWMLNLDLLTLGFQHNAGSTNMTFAANTNDETVFTVDAFTGIEDVSVKENKIYADYTVAYAPTIYYNLATTNSVDISVYDMNGRVVLADKNQNFEGNYFIRKELLTGQYMIVFSNGDTEESFKFVVQN